MTNFITIIKYDYLQRARSYRFLITLCLSLACAYSFIPGPDASYTTVGIGDYTGLYNSAWIANVSAIMASLFLSIFGYYLINNSIKIDIENKLGQIIATSGISNFGYLMTKMVSNFLVLLTIMFLIFVMSIAQFFLYNNGFNFQPWEFILAYLLIPIPTIFFISTIAVVFEVLLGERSILQNILFFSLIMGMIVPSPLRDGDLDLFGTSLSTQSMEAQVKAIDVNNSNLKLTMGFVIGRENSIQRFEFDGFATTGTFLLFRVLWMVLGIGLIALSSRYFRRFDTKKTALSKKKDIALIEGLGLREVDLMLLPKAQDAQGIFPFYKTELLIMIRKGTKWFWLLNLLGILFMVLLPISAAHTIVLPIVWFLQVNRWADLITKEKGYGMHYFAFSSFKPLSRLLTAQLLAGITIGIILAFPIMLRLLLDSNYAAVLAVFIGAFFIVLLASSLGILSGGKRLFETLFFLITYMNINLFPFTDYFGGLNTSNSYLMTMTCVVLVLLIAVYSLRKFELNRI